jgi:hypothetical protein
MTQTDERRASGVQRMPFETLVEVCSNDPGIPAFEAESVDVSGRGMQVRTAYLPQIGDALVCRMEDEGREILVEGVVAWRSEKTRGGEFGLKFTALDSGSVEALNALCTTDAEETSSDEAEPEAAPVNNQPGARVRLHIDGLGSPMKARVREAGRSQLHVGSNLEFLKVGKRLEIEDLDSRARRVARIDSVSVSIDPETRVPQLVVTLKYDGIEDGEATPEPSVIDAAQREPRRAAHREAAERRRSAPAVEAASDEELQDAATESANAFRGKLGNVAAGAAAFAKVTGSNVTRASTTAAASLGQLLKSATEKVADYRKRQNPPPPRRTSPAPSTQSEPRRLRPQSSKRDEPTSDGDVSGDKRARLKKYGVVAGAATLALTVIVFAMRPGAPPPGAEQKAEAAPAAAPADMKNVDAEGNPVAPPAPLGSSKKPLTADVPLFGATPMATTEPAPLGAPPEELQAAGLAPEKAATPPVADESWSEDGDEPQDKPESVRPEAVKPWGHGKVRDPLVHRLRLDGRGAAIQGHTDPTGFTVLIPGRKLLENGSAITKRDPRIARVKTQSTAAGAEVTFQFRDGVPGYRVRLRNDSVEFLVSDEEVVKRTTKPSKSTAKAVPVAKKVTARANTRQR